MKKLSIISLFVLYVNSIYCADNAEYKLFDGAILNGRQMDFENEGEPHTTTLELDYKKFSEQEKSRVQLVPEHIATALSQHVKNIDYLLIGPTYPCMAIIVHNKDNNIINVLHYMDSESNDETNGKIYQTDINAFINFLSIDLLAQQKNQNIKIYFYLVYNNNEVSRSYAEQESKLQTVKKVFQQKLGLADACFKVFFHNLDGCKANNESELFVVVDKQGKLYNTSPISEGLDFGHNERATNAIEEEYPEPSRCRKLPNLAENDRLKLELGFKTLWGPKCLELERERLRDNYFPTYGSRDPNKKARELVPCYVLLLSPACKMCQKSATSLSACGRCKKVSYCGKECQTKHWPNHKQNCKNS